MHMLNATLVACTRTICAILENYQTPEVSQSGGGKQAGHTGREGQAPTPCYVLCWWSIWMSGRARAGGAGAVRGRHHLLPLRQGAAKGRRQREGAGPQEGAGSTGRSQGQAGEEAGRCQSAALSLSLS